MLSKDKDLDSISISTLSSASESAYYKGNDDTKTDIDVHKPIYSRSPSYSRERSASGTTIEASSDITVGSKINIQGPVYIAHVANAEGANGWIKELTETTNVILESARRESDLRQEHGDEPRRASETNRKESVPKANGNASRNYEKNLVNAAVSRSRNVKDYPNITIRSIQQTKRIKWKNFFKSRSNQTLIGILGSLILIALMIVVIQLPQADDGRFKEIPDTFI